MTNRGWFQQEGWASLSLRIKGAGQRAKARADAHVRGLSVLCGGTPPPLASTGSHGSFPRKEVGMQVPSPGWAPLLQHPRPGDAPEKTSGQGPAVARQKSRDPSLLSPSAALRTVTRPTYPLNVSVLSPPRKAFSPQLHSQVPTLEERRHLSLKPARNVRSSPSPEAPRGEQPRPSAEE